MTHTAEGDAATSVISTRRGLLGASFAGAALSLIAGDQRRLRSTERVIDADLALLRFVQSLELAASDLYAAAVAAGADDPVFGVLVDQHKAYAEGIAGFVGRARQHPQRRGVRRARIGVRRVRPNCGRDRRLRPRVGRRGHPHSSCWRGSRTSTAPSWSPRCWRWRPAIASSSPTCPVAATTSTCLLVNTADPILPEELS